MKSTKSLTLFVVLSILISSTPGIAANKKSLNPKKPAPVKNQILWDAWYTGTLEGKLNYLYYNEKIEVLGDQLKIQYRSWKNEEGHINEEHEGAISEATPILRPLFYNLYRSYRGESTTIDGTIKNGILTATVKKSDPTGTVTSPAMSTPIPDKAFFGLAFPLWLRFHLKEIKPNGTPKSFLSLLEDNVERKFPAAVGSVRWVPQDDFARSTQTTKIELTYADMTSTWWVKDSGQAIKIDMSQQGLMVVEVSKSQAESFLPKLPLPTPKGP